MTSHTTSSIVLIHQLKVGRTNAPLRLHIHQRLFTYGNFQGNGFASLFFPLGVLDMVAKETMVDRRRIELTRLVLAVAVR